VDNLQGKFAGASGGFNAHDIAAPDADWMAVAEEFVTSLGLEYVGPTTQIKPRDDYADLFHRIHELNSVLVDLDRDMWLYISRDSTVMRNIGVALAHTLLGYQKTREGLTGMQPSDRMQEELAERPAVLGEAIQTVLRLEGYPDAYERVKAATRGTTLTQDDVAGILDGRTHVTVSRTWTRQGTPGWPRNLQSRRSGTPPESSRRTEDERGPGAAVRLRQDRDRRPCTVAARSRCRTSLDRRLDGRVKTLHPRIHAGILSRRTDSDRETLDRNDIDPIDLVVVNLYPFTTSVRDGADGAEAREQIDIGGHTLIRAAAKNHPHVGVVVDPTDYDRVVTELAEGGGLSAGTREELARRAFHHTAVYDATIGSHMRGETDFPDELPIGLRKRQETRYGENPHQRGAFYEDPLHDGPSITTAEKLHGGELSFNNINDANAAVELIKEFDGPAAAVFKHTNPCGAAVADSVATAFERALACDPDSAFGGIIALNRTCGIDTATQIADFFNEIVIAPDYTDAAVEELRSGEKPRILKVEGLDAARPSPSLSLTDVEGGMLAQETDTQRLEADDLEQVTERAPSRRHVDDMRTGWQIAKHVKSNAILLVKDGATVGIGAGQMSRVDAVGLAVEEAGDRAEDAVMVSDGSIRDDQVIEAADDHGMAMCFTGRRCFLH
ncbi:MAG: bifunctional phosphoribosylaminoimidazolecarboxamide formyltransferase/IMP cyclohydrolase, partial [Candidatus Nanohaloarchaea archaeon]